MEYSFDFSEQILKAADLLGLHHDGENETARVVVYQSCVSMEIAMKCLLEHAGKSPQAIRKHNHRIMDLLEAVDALHKNGDTLEPWDKLWCEVVDGRLPNGSVGLLLSEADKGSTYPNEMRYGSQMQCISPHLVLETAKVVLNWCKSNAGQLVYVPTSAMPAKTF